MSLSASALQEQIDQLGLADIPDRFFTREGVEVDSSSDEWVVACTDRVARLKFSRVVDPRIAWACKRYAMHRMQIASTGDAAGFFSTFCELIRPRLKAANDIGELSRALAKSVSDAIKDLRSRQKLWRIYRIVRWYVWCADRFPELGFQLDYADELDRMAIPGDPKGEAVRSDDPERGPLDRTLELPLLIHALDRDKSQALDHIEQRAAVALCIAIGRNPANFAFLEERDLVNLTQGIPDVPACYVLKVPRIKKRQLSPRDELRDVPLDNVLARHVSALKGANRSEPVTVLTTEGEIEASFRPLFRRPIGATKPVPKALVDRAARCGSSRMNELLKSFVERLGIVSPLTNELMAVTPRRLRYTFGTGLAEEGISRKELANLLDHSDTQHVRVYFDAKHRIVRQLDAAVAKRFSGMLNFFIGKVIDNPEEDPNGRLEDKRILYVSQTDPTDQEEIGVCGKRSLCHLDPPFSCYLCEKFRPLRHADHQHVLDCMLLDREERLQKYEDGRLGVQLDDVIFAVAQVVELCQVGAEKSHE